MFFFHLHGLHREGESIALYFHTQFAVFSTSKCSRMVLNSLAYCSVSSSLGSRQEAARFFDFVNGNHLFHQPYFSLCHELIVNTRFSVKNPEILPSVEVVSRIN